MRGLASAMETCVVQVTNVAPTASIEQISTLFSFLGKILELKMYPSDEFLLQPVAKVCYIRFEESWSVGVAQHLTNTVFVDRALIVVPVADGKLPDESRALALTAPVSAPEDAAAPKAGLVNQVAMGSGGVQVITTQDPQLAAMGLPPYPPLPATMDPTKVEEIRRTVYVGNLDSSATTEQLLKFFSQMGEVKYVRMAGGESQPTRFAFVEFTEQSSVGRALQFNGIEFAGRSLKINHSNNAIVKPQAKSSEAAHKEIEEAMRRVREAQSLITAAIEPEMAKQQAAVSPLNPATATPMLAKRRSRTKSRSKSRSKRRDSRSPSSHSRSNRRRSRSGSYSSSRHRRSRSGSPSVSRHRRRHRRSRSKHGSPPPRRRRSSSGRRASRRHSRSRSPPPSRKSRRREEVLEPRRRKKMSRSPPPRKSSRHESPPTPPRRSSKKKRRSRSPKRSKSRKVPKDEGKVPAVASRDYDEEEKGYTQDDRSHTSGDMELASD